MTLYKKITLMANNVVENVNKHQELPVQTGYNWRQYCYLFARSVLNPYKNITSKPVAKAPKQKGTAINTDISRTDYLTLAKNLVNFVDKYGYLPNYLGYGKYKIRPVLYCYMFAKIVAYMSKGKSYPNYCHLDSEIYRKKTYKKYGHATEYGCNNKGQNNGYYCGCHSLQEVFRNLTGIVIPQSTIAEVCGTTTDGTDHDGLNTCIAWFNRKYNKNLTLQWYNFSELGWNKIRNIINSNNQDCVIHNLYRNQWGHYEVINKVYDDYCDVQNSLGDKCSNGCYCGYTEERNLSTFQSYINGISQKSVMVITNES